MTNGNERVEIDAEVGSWPEYRRYVVAQLRETSTAMSDIKSAIAEQRIKMASLDARLINIINGNIDRRIETIESTLNWAKGIGMVLGLAWSVFLVWVSRWFK